MRFKEYYNFPYSDISQNLWIRFKPSKKKKEKKLMRKLIFLIPSYNRSDIHSDGTMSVQ